jgi:hypothetical protein
VWPPLVDGLSVRLGLSGRAGFRGTQPAGPCGPSTCASAPLTGASSPPWRSRRLRASLKSRVLGQRRQHVRAAVGERVVAGQVEVGDCVTGLVIVRVERRADDAAPLRGLLDRLGDLRPGEQPARGDAVVLKRLVSLSRESGSADGRRSSAERDPDWPTMVPASLQAASLRRQRHIFSSAVTFVPRQGSYG